MNRRECLSVVAAASGLLAMGGASAQGQFQEGKDFTRLSKAAEVKGLAEGKKVEVVEFFWYGCPHCNSFEPALDAWAKRLDGDVSFRRVPVAFGGVHQLHQKLYYALEKMPNFDMLHKRVFAAMHVDKRRLDTVASIAEWAKESGLQEDALMGEFRSMRVDSASRMAKLTAASYGVDSVPSTGVHGKFLTSPGMAGTYDRAFGVVQSLIQQVRAIG